MSTVAEIHTVGLDLFQNLIPKTAVITFPTTCPNSLLKNKQFKITQVSVSSLSDEVMKKTDSTYSNESLTFTFLNSVLLLTKDVTNTVNCPLYGFKDNVVTISYKKKKYAVKEELLNEMDSSISLLCSITT